MPMLQAIVHMPQMLIITAMHMSSNRHTAITHTAHTKVTTTTIMPHHMANTQNTINTKQIP